MRFIQLFKSNLYTVKSVYRKKQENGNLKIFISFNETNDKYSFTSDDKMDFLKKNALITVHTNDKNICIEEGNKIDKNSVRFSYILSQKTL